MKLRILVVVGFCWSTIAVGCSKGGDVTSSRGQSCKESGSFTTALLGFSQDGGCCGSLSLTVNWGMDGSATVNGQNCAAFCRNVDASVQPAFVPCRDLGQPPTDPVYPNACGVQIFCCTNVNSGIFPGTSASGLPSCDAVSPSSVGRVIFYPNDPNDISAGESASVDTAGAWSSSLSSADCEYSNGLSVDSGVKCSIADGG